MKNCLYLLTLLILPLAGCKNRSTAPETPRVDKVIFMIGDGMGVAQITDFIMAQEVPTNMQRATHGGLALTYSANNRVTDSAAAGTALATGTKTDNSWLGMAPDSTWLKSTMAKAAEKGMSTGFAVTITATHATPAAFYAHVDSRYKTQEIAEQLLDSGIDVFFGEGGKEFTDREDGRDLTAEFEAKGYRMIYNDISEAATVTSGKLGGLFSRQSPMPRMLDGRGDYLPEATRKALEILNNNANGFFLMVEGSQIDYGGHANDIEYIYTETVDFDKAVGMAFDFADANPGTLVVVTADHETGGLTLISGSDDFTASESGLDARFSTESHSASMVPVLAYGTGAEYFGGIMDNTDIPRIMQQLMGLN